MCAVSHDFWDFCEHRGHLSRLSLSSVQELQGKSHIPWLDVYFVFQRKVSNMAANFDFRKKK